VRCELRVLIILDVLNLVFILIKLKDKFMNKSELIDAIASKSDVTKIVAGKVLDGVVSVITEALGSGDQVALIGFGTFSVKDRAARVGRNPQTGQEIKIAATKVPSFKAGKNLKEAVN